MKHLSLLCFPFHFLDKVFEDTKPKRLFDVKLRKPNLKYTSFSDLTSYWKFLQDLKKSASEVLKILPNMNLWLGQIFTRGWSCSLGRFKSLKNVFLTLSNREMFFFQASFLTFNIKNELSFFIFFQIAHALSEQSIIFHNSGTENEKTQIYFCMKSAGKP